MFTLNYKFDRMGRQVWNSCENKEINKPGVAELNNNLN